MNIKIPFQVNSGSFESCKDLKQSIDSFISLILTTSCNCTLFDPQFGFVFNNLKFEMFNEHEGVVYNSSMPSDFVDDSLELYSKKISGSSKNLNTFSAELKKAIENYEMRLSNISVSMTYIREERIIHVVIKGIITESSADYQYNTTIKIWN